MSKQRIALRPEEKVLARRVADLSYCNPFLPERIELERSVLGDDFEPWSPVISKQIGLYEPGRNVFQIVERAEKLVATVARRATEAGGAVQGEDAADLEGLAMFVLFHRHVDRMDPVIEKSLSGKPIDGDTMDFYDAFRAIHDAMMRPLDGVRADYFAPHHVFALLFQIRRAFHHIFEAIVGPSMPAARLRAAVWESIFTCDLRRYARALFDRMAGLSCLITGPSGTGKELVARAVAMARYIPFGEKKRTFAEDFAAGFHPLNLSALSPTLIESELFGHRRNSFTGALEDRVGWLETCSPRGTVFLDEIGDVDAGIQVKLLRVLETRVFQRIGDTEDRRFEGKILAATNRDLAAEIREGRFREDLYYRLCADRVVTPALRDHLDGNPEALDDILAHLALKLVSAEEAPALADQVARWIREHLGEDYPWPGNFRELEQCVRNVLIRGVYRPLEGATRCEPMAAWLGDISQGRPTADELLARYCTLVYRETGTYQETARRLGIDHRTVKSRIDWDWLKTLEE